MEMCLAWGLAPHWVDNFPRNVKKEMMVFFTWKNTRERLLREKAEAEMKQKQQGWR